MSERTRALREVIYSHQPADPFVVIKVMLDVIDTQDARIKGLEEELQHAKAHHDERVMVLSRRIDKLSGVHGA